MKININKVKIIIQKNIKDIITNKRVFFPMIFTPISLLIFSPVMFLLISQSTDINLPNALMDNLPTDVLKSIEGMELKDQITFLFINYVMGSFFLLIPIMLSSWVSASSMVSEKENKTMETLLFAPITKTEFFIGKITSSFIVSYSLSLFAFIVYFIVLQILLPSNVQFGLEGFWWALIGILLPIAIIFSIIANILVSTKSKTSQEAQQMSIIVTFPFMLLLISQLMGDFYINTHNILVISSIFLVVDFICVYLLTKYFTNEKILKM